MSKSPRVGGTLTQELLNPKKPPIYQDLLLVSIFILVVTIDQITKMLVRANLQIHESIPSEGIPTPQILGQYSEFFQIRP